MPRISATVAVLFVLLVSHGGAQPVDAIFSLVLPPRGTPEASVARIRDIYYHRSKNQPKPPV